MKALKEKRIGLRSLWRRGLVILSLFALVFASCNSSSDDDSPGPSSKKVPLEIKVSGTVKTWEGIAVDVTGAKVEARYAGPTPLAWVTVPEAEVKANYGIYPKYGQRGGTSYILYTIADGTPVYAQFSSATANLVRKDSSSATNPADNMNQNQDSNISANGLQVTVTNYRKTYRVDEFPDLVTGIKVQGHYSDGSIQDIPLSLDMRWEIQPDYSKAPATGPGNLVIAVGGNTAGSPGDSLWNSIGIGGYAPPTDQNYETVTIPLTEVYHVIGIEIANPDDIKAALDKSPMFYWMDDRNSAWLNADGTGGRVKDAKLKITYSGGPLPFQVLDMRDAVRTNTVYWNYNPNGDERPLTVRGIDESVTKVDNQKSLWPMHRAPKIYFYYRGHTVAYNVPIYNRFTGISVTPVSETDQANGYISIDMTHRDNDNVILKTPAQDFAGKIKVVATFTATSDTTLPAAEWEVKYQAPRPVQTRSDKDSTLTTSVTPNDGGGAAGYTPVALSATPATFTSAYDTQMRSIVAQGKPFRGWGTISAANGNNTWIDTGYSSGGGTGATTSATNGWDGGPNVYTMTFGDPDYTWDSAKKIWTIGVYAWGDCANPGNNGRTRNVTVWYTPGVGPGPRTTATSLEPWSGITTTPTPVTPPPARSQRVSVAWSNIPPIPTNP